MPICRHGGRDSSSRPGTSRAASTAPGASRASTVVPGECSDDGDGDGAFVLLRDPSKMQKHEIVACFTHWMARQEEGKIAFEFSNVFNSREGTLRAAVRLEELSDLGDTESDSAPPPPPPRNQPKSKRGGKNAKQGQPKVATKKSKKPAPQSHAASGGNTSPPPRAGPLPPHLPNGLLPLEWDPALDPVLQDNLMPASGVLPLMPGPVGDPTAINGTNPEYAAHLAQMERGGGVMQGVVPAWMKNNMTQQPSDPPLRPAIRRDHIQVDPNPTRISSGERTTAGIFQSLSLATDHGNEPSDTNPSDTNPPDIPPGSSDSPIPDYTTRWMRTRSRSRGPKEGSMVAQHKSPATVPPAAGNKRHRALSSGERDQKKSKPAKPVDRPKPRRKVAGGARLGDRDMFDLRDRHAP
jgi:hypothetical protein